MKSLKDQILDSCVHFTGIQNKTCRVGVDYVSVRDESSGGPYRWPCVRFDKNKPAATTCEKASFLTEEQAQAEADKMARASDEAIARHAKGEDGPGFAVMCTSHDLHPYECGGSEEGCRHCLGVKSDRHDPETCGLCEDGR